MRQQTRELALAGMMAALGGALLFLSGVIPLALYACPMLASLVLLPVREECRKSYRWSCFAAIAILGLLLCPDKEAALLYCFLGYYPLVQPKLDAMRSRGTRLAAKLALCIVAVGTMYAAIVFVFRLSAVISELENTAPWLLVLTLFLGVAVFVLYDVLLHRAAILYRRRKRKGTGT